LFFKNVNLKEPIQGNCRWHDVPAVSRNWSFTVYNTHVRSFVRSWIRQLTNRIR